MRLAQNLFSNVWTITGPANAVTGPASKGARLCSITALIACDKKMQRDLT
jgi:hypothetical protein